MLQTYIFLKTEKKKKPMKIYITYRVFHLEKYKPAKCCHLLKDFDINAHNIYNRIKYIFLSRVLLQFY